MIYEDDYEYEEQPSYVRDRQIPGRTPGRGGGGRRTRPRRSQARGVPESAAPARDLLKEILDRMGVAPAEIGFIEREEGEYLEVSGPDLAALIGRRGNTLEALNSVFNNIINAGTRTNRRYYTIDAEGYRAERADRLKDLARATQERCVREGKAQRLEPMLPSERKIVHLALAENDSVRTESEGEEPERRVVVFPTGS
ncbi:MAG: protein jag [Candidatus Tyrphobacter sp.]